MVCFRVEKLLNLKYTKADVTKLHLDANHHDLGKASATSAAEHVVRLLYVHLGVVGYLDQTEFRCVIPRRIPGYQLSRVVQVVCLEEKRINLSFLKFILLSLLKPTYSIVFLSVFDKTHTMHERLWCC